MAETFEVITPEIADFVAAQEVFFVATAPRDGGNVNVSPKGLDTFRVLDARTVAWLDLTGSGVETIAHLRENGRITMLFCAFTGKPLIVRIAGTGTVLRVGTPGADGLLPRFPSLPGARSIIRVAVERVATSCGYGVPLMQYQGDRRALPAWAESKGAEGLVEYRALKNAASIDGLPGLP